MFKKDNKNLKKIKILFVIFILTLTLNFISFEALASETPPLAGGRQIMSQMMGSNYNSMVDFMNKTMGANGMQSIYDMMEKISASGLNASDIRPIGDLINACQTQTTISYNTGGMMKNFNWSGMMNTGLGIGGIFLLLGGIIMVIFWIIIIIAGIALLRWLINYLKTAPNSSDKAMGILKEKYAKSEITKEEFETKKRDLL